MSAWTDAEEQDARAADDARMREWAAEHPDPRTALAQAQAEVTRLLARLARVEALADEIARPFADGVPDREGEALAGEIRDAVRGES